MASADLRKKPTKHQRALIRKFAAVIEGKATVVQPKNPASYKGLFQVKGKKVIVPRHKGEKIRVTKFGNIIGERKLGKRVVRSRYRRVNTSADLPKSATRSMYFVPFIRGKDATGRPILEWKRFPNLDMLKNFMEGYDYKDWTNYVIEEKVDADHAYTNSEGLTNRLNRKLGSKRRKRIKFDDDDGDNEE